MSTELISRIRAFLEKLNIPDWQLSDCPEYSSLDLVLHTQCFVTCFTILNLGDSIFAKHNEAEQDIFELKSTNGNKWPRDLNLVLIAENEDDVIAIRSIVDDRHLCRKFILILEDRSIEDVLPELPFVPSPDLTSGEVTQIDRNLKSILEGYDATLIRDLTGYSPGAERVAEKVCDESYHLGKVTKQTGSLAIPGALSGVVRRLSAIEIRNFRGIRELEEKTLNLEHDIVLVYGPNGVGKTSIVQAIEWAITGQVHRISQSAQGRTSARKDPIINLFGSGEVMVKCHFNLGSSICRRKSEADGTSLTIGNSGNRNDRQAIDHVVGTKAPSSERKLEIGQLRDLFRGSHLLSQHTIREFLDELKPTQRFDTLTSMIGAEAFTRFRTKVENVSKMLTRKVADLSMEVDFVKSELDNTSEKLKSREERIHELEDTLIPGVTPIQLLEQLLAGLQSTGCNFDESILEYQGEEPSSQDLELMSVHVSSAIQNKEIELSSNLIRLESLQKNLSEYQKSIDKIQEEGLQSQQLRKSHNTTAKRLEEIENKRRKLQDRKTQAESKLEVKLQEQSTMMWLLANMSQYLKDKTELEEKKTAISELKSALVSLESALAEKKTFLSKQQSDLHELNGDIEQKEQLTSKVDRLIDVLPSVSLKVLEIQQLNSQKKNCKSDYNALSEQLAMARANLDVSKETLNEVRSQYDSEKSRHDRETAALITLSNLIDSPDCPLCGRIFTSVEEAREIISSNVQHSSSKLVVLTESLTRATSSFNDNTTAVESIRVKLDSQMEQIRRIEKDESECNEVVRQFLSDCSNIGLTTTQDDHAKWQDQLTLIKTRTKLDVLLADRDKSKGQMQELITECDQINLKLETHRREQITEEGNSKILSKRILDVENEMISRRISQDDLPSSDDLSFRLETLRKEIETLNTELRELDDDLTKLKKREEEIRDEIQQIERNIKERESIVEKLGKAKLEFESECRNFKIGLGNPASGIDQRLKDTINTTAYLESLKQVSDSLQTFSKLALLKDELTTYVDAVKSLNATYDSKSLESSRLSEWNRHFKTLAQDVVKGQRDVVGAHLQSLEPVTQLLYKRLNSHPVFGKIGISVNEHARSLDFVAEATHNKLPKWNMSIVPPKYFSDAQMNLLAITVFLGGALQQTWSNFGTIVIDDPIQQMDEMNVYSFIDLIRGLGRERQFIIFTCSKDFYQLSRERLRCLNRGGSKGFCAYRLEGIAPAPLTIHCDEE